MGPGSTSLGAGLKIKREQSQALVFDLDGTLWDATETYAMATNRVLTARKMIHEPISASKIAQSAGLPFDQCFEFFFPTLEKDLRVSLAHDIVAEFDRVVQVEGGKLFPGVRETLHKLSETLPLLIVSNCSDGYIEGFLTWSGYSKLFLDYECYGRTGLSKSENIRLVMNRNSLRSGVYIGDTSGDEKAAQEAGLVFIHAAYGFGSASPDALAIKSLPEMLNFLT